jgi:uncharacterized protein (DUF58 family)
VTSNSRPSLDPKILDKIAGLELKARHIVEGYISGLHRSPFHGYSVEFAEHREYVPGDDTRFLDWKVFGRTDRLYIKRYEEETNLEAWIVVDTSASMAYAAPDARGPSKLDYATWGAAALAYMITHQQDAAGLVLFDEKVHDTLPAQSNEAHLRAIFARLEAIEAAHATGAGRALSEVAEAVRRRGIIVLFSDLLDDMHEVVRGLKQLRSRGHEVVLFHVLAEDEVTFPFERLTRFEGMEDATRLLADPLALRTAYLEEVEAFRRNLRRVCLGNRIDLVELSTADSLGVVLSAYLARRAARRRK